MAARSVNAWLRQLGDGTPPVDSRTPDVSAISSQSDKYDGYIQAACEILSGICIVVDRFHVIPTYRNAADVVRKQELDRLKHALPTAEYKQLKDSPWAFRKTPPIYSPMNRPCWCDCLPIRPACKWLRSFQRKEYTKHVKLVPWR